MLDLLKSNILHLTELPSPVMAAIKKDDGELFELLLRHGGDIHLKRWLERSERKGLWVCREMLPIEYVVERDDLPWLKRLLPHFRRQRDGSNHTPLHKACLYNSPKCLNYLLSLPDTAENINLPEKFHENTPLFYMVTFNTGTTESIQSLLDHGANPLLKDNDQKTLLHNLAQWYRFLPSDTFVEKAKFLIDAGVDPLAEDKYHLSALECFLGSLEKIGIPPESDFSDSIELKCRKFINAIPALLPLNGGEALASKALRGAMFISYDCDDGMFKSRIDLNGDARKFQMHVNACPTLLATIKELIEILLSFGADPGSQAPGVRLPADTVVYNFRPLHCMYREKCDVNLSKAFVEHRLEILRLILSSGRSSVKPESMYCILTWDVEHHMRFLQAYLDSLHLADHRGYIDDVLGLLADEDTLKRVKFDFEHEYVVYMPNNDILIKDALTSYRDRLLTLRYLSRHCIVSVIGISCRDVETLPLPDTLKQYINLEQ